MNNQTRDVLVQSDSDGNWQVYTGDSLNSYAAGIWRDAPQEKRVRRDGFLGWLGFTKKVVEGPNGRVESNEVRSLKPLEESTVKDTGLSAVPLPPEVQSKPWKAQHYEVRLRFGVDGSVQGSTQVNGRAIGDLSEIRFDLAEFPTKTEVLGPESVALEHRREAGQLIVPQSLKAGESFQLSLGFEGTPRPDRHPAISSELGWLASKDSIVTMNGVENASTWMPTDNDPSNKAAYDFHLHVPKGQFALANGELVGVTETDSGREFHYRTSTPMASHLASVNVFDEKAFARTKVGQNMEVVHPKGMEEKVKAEFARHDEMMDFFSQRLGPYPFASYGAIVCDLPVEERELNLTDGTENYSFKEKKYHMAFEAQTRPIYEARGITGNGDFQGTLFHELAHQWFGNSLGKASEKDIWVAEGFPSYCDLLWLEQTRGAEALEQEVQAIHEELKQHKFTDTMASPDRDKVFSDANYKRMRLSMHALRKTLGDEQFYATLKGTLAEHRDQAVTCEQMAQTMNRLNGGKLDNFFQQWLHQRDVPDLPK